MKTSEDISIDQKIQNLDSQSAEIKFLIRLTGVLVMNVYVNKVIFHK